MSLYVKQFYRVIALLLTKINTIIDTRLTYESSSQIRPPKLGGYPPQCPHYSTLSPSKDTLQSTAPAQISLQIPNAHPSSFSPKAAAYPSQQHPLHSQRLSSSRSSS